MTATEAPARTSPGWMLVPPLVLLFVFLVFAHGCHAGGHDDELSAVEARQDADP